MVASGGRKSTGSNFGTVVCCLWSVISPFCLPLSAFHIFRALPILFPIIQRRHGDKAKVEIKKAESGNQTRIAQINSVYGSVPSFVVFP
jgi:hypothetical protein